MTRFLLAFGFSKHAPCALGLKSIKASLRTIRLSASSPHVQTSSHSRWPFRWTKGTKVEAQRQRGEANVRHLRSNVPRGRDPGPGTRQRPMRSIVVLRLYSAKWITTHYDHVLPLKNPSWRWCGGGPTPTIGGPEFTGGADSSPWNLKFNALGRSLPHSSSTWTPSA